MATFLSLAAGCTHLTTDLIIARLQSKLFWQGQCRDPPLCYKGELRLPFQPTGCDYMLLEQYLLALRLRSHYMVKHPLVVARTSACCGTAARLLSSSGCKYFCLLWDSGPGGFTQGYSSASCGPADPFGRYPRATANYGTRY